jgi:hypothetical protein
LIYGHHGHHSKEAKQYHPCRRIRRDGEQTKAHEEKIAVITIETENVTINVVLYNALLLVVSGR